MTPKLTKCNGMDVDEHMDDLRTMGLSCSREMEKRFAHTFGDAALVKLIEARVHFEDLDFS
jgi:hypothetical protein